MTRQFRKPCRKTVSCILISTLRHKIVASGKPARLQLPPPVPPTFFLLLPQRRLFREYYATSLKYRKQLRSRVLLVSRTFWGGSKGDNSSFHCATPAIVVFHARALYLPAGDGFFVVQRCKTKLSRPRKNRVVNIMK